MSSTAEQASVDPLPTAPPLVSMRGISKSYGERKILDGIALDVAQGEKVALIGPSGSGKTTILRLAIGLVKPDEGTIRIDGNYLWHEAGPGGLRPAGERHARKVRRSLGIVFQHFNLFPHMTKDHLDKRPAQLSGGQQQRVAIARSLALRPKVMLFDEVTSALDPELVGEVLRVVRDLAHASDMSMLIVTHEISFASDIADRVLMFDAGKIVEDGPPSQVLKNPESPRTRKFLQAILER